MLTVATWGKMTDEGAAKMARPLGISDSPQGNAAVMLLRINQIHLLQAMKEGLRW